MRVKLITAIVLVVLVVLFAAKNANPTTFWFFGSFEPKLSVLLLVCFIVGVVVGLLLTAVGRKVEKKQAAGTFK